MSKVTNNQDAITNLFAERLERYRKRTSSDVMKYVSEIEKKYRFQLNANNYLEAFLLQIPIVEIWLILILEHKYILIHFSLVVKFKEYYNYDYRNNKTTLSGLINEYKKFFPDLIGELIWFRNKRNSISHFVFEEEKITKEDVERASKLIDTLKEKNQEVFNEVRLISELVKLIHKQP